MLGLLFYTAEDLRRNQWFVEQLCENAESEGITLRLCFADEGIPYGVMPDLVLNRSRIAEISAYYEAKGIRVCNSEAVTRITNDKWQTHCFLRSCGIPTAETCAVNAETVFCPMEPPLIAKPLDGHGGAGVEWLADADAVSRAMAEKPRPFLVQQPMQRGWDMRVYVLGGEIYAAMLRTSQTEFRSNFSLGGHAQRVTPDAQVRELVDRVQRALPLDYAGVDLLRTPEGGYVIGEIEDAVGCRMLYDCGGFDPVRDYLRMAANGVKNRIIQ